MSAAPATDIEALRARAERERRARREAEAIGERTARESYSRERDLELLKTVAQASNAAERVEDALDTAIAAVIDHTGWPLGHAFLRRGDKMVSTGIWSQDDHDQFRGYRAATMLTEFAWDVGLPGRVLATGRPVWIEDVREDGAFTRTQAALEASLGAAFAFPLLIGAEVVGALEFFSSHVRKPDAHLLELVANVGAHLGRIIERDRNTRELAKRAQEIESANDELKEFAYVASHDLSEPLRTVSGFAQLLSERYEGQLDETADEFIEFIVDGTGRMQKLIDGLLAYSRAGRMELAREPIEMTELVADGIASLTAAIEAADARIEVLNLLPTVYGDPLQLRRLIENLLSNAIKFRRPGVAPEIRISAERGDDHWKFTFADNGIGIADRHREKIFSVFQRLHAVGEYPGTGIGLSICRKVAERHGGTIWVEDTEGGGTTFVFTVAERREVTA